MFTQPMSSPVRTAAPIISGNVVVCLTEFDQETFFPGTHFDRLLAFAPRALLLRPAGKDTIELGRHLHELRPEVVVGGWSTPRLPEILPDTLKYLCFLCGSVKAITSRRHLENGLQVTNWGGSISRTIAEAALHHILACLRRSPHWTLEMHVRRGWREPATEGMSLFGLTVGLHGFGRVSRALIRLLQPFEVKLKVFAPDADEAAGRTFGFTPAASLDALFSDSDVVVELAPLIPETTGVVQERHLRLLPPGGVFVNVARGAIVDEAGLVRVAQEGSIRFGLDVFATEPLASEHPLRGLSNVYLTPHIAGPTANCCRDVGEFALSNLQRFAAGEKLKALITPETYDQST
jgi:phosphoglycerate dehydrogenase-like enzyme